MADTATSKNKNRRIRQEALREQLSAGQHVNHVIDIVSKLMNEEVEIDRDMANRYKIALDAKFKLIDKYLPTEKPTTIEGNGENGAVVLSWLN